MLARADLLSFLKKDCEERGATIIYATHIFDGLESWPSHIVSNILSVMLKLAFELYAFYKFEGILISGLCGSWEAAVSNAYG